MTLTNLGWASAILARRYPDRTDIDTALAEAIHSHFSKDGRALDVGCGKSGPLGPYGATGYVVGTDIDYRELTDNRECRARVVSDGAALPFASDTFDLLLSKTAIEHMRSPEDFFRSVHRVLKPGGVFVWATSNVRSLPILLSKFTPLGFHKLVYRRLLAESLEIDQFPTYYRANTESSLNTQLEAAGFRRIALERKSWPQYFAISRALFLVMLPVHVWLERAGLEWLQVHLVGVYKKP